ERSILLTRRNSSDGRPETPVAPAGSGGDVLMLIRNWAYSAGASSSSSTAASARYSWHSPTCRPSHHNHGRQKKTARPAPNIQHVHTSRRRRWASSWANTHRSAVALSHRDRGSTTAGRSSPQLIGVGSRSETSSRGRERSGVIAANR